MKITAVKGTREVRYSPGKITLIYAVVAGLWALASPWLLPDLHWHSQMVDRVLFVAVTTGLLYVIIYRYTAALERATATAREFIRSAAESIVIIDAEGHIVDVNPKTLTTFGYREDELLGQSVEILLPERLREKNVSLRASYFGPRPRSASAGFDLVGRRKDGMEFPIDVGLSLIQSEGSSAHAIASIIDITERLALEREARRADTLVALGAVAAGVGHELNNPLAIISSRIELMLSEQNLSPQMREDLQVLLRQAKRASSIAGDLLALSRQAPKSLEPVNVNDVTERTIALLNGQFRADGIRVSSNLDRALPRMLGDPTALEQVLINLMMNARDAMPAGGEIRINSSRLPDKPGWLRLAVADNGCGIAPEAVPKLFNLFYTTKPGGTGLGLWLCERIIREHHGNIDVRSEPGKGTTFTLTLPASGGPAKPV